MQSVIQILELAARREMLENPAFAQNEEPCTLVRSSSIRSCRAFTALLAIILTDPVPPANDPVKREIV